MADIFGTPGNDDLTGTGGNDVIYGGDGDDLLNGIQGTDQLFGEAGDDILVQVGPPTLLETYNGGDGNDTLLLFGVPTPTPNGITSQFNFLQINQIVDVETLEISGGAGTRTNVVFQLSQEAVVPTHFIGGDGGTNIVYIVNAAGVYNAPLVTVENFQTGNADRYIDDGIVLLAATSAPVTLNANTANRGYVTTLNGGGGNDILNGGNGRDVFIGGAGQDQMFGGGNQDIFLFVHNTIAGQPPQSNTFVGDVAIGGSGYDVAAFGGTVFFLGRLDEIEEIALLPEFVGERTAASLYLSTGVDLGTSLVRVSGTGFISIEIEEGDTFDGSAFEVKAGSTLLFDIFGSSADDNIIGTSTDDIITGYDGNDTLTGAKGNDELYGRAGDDLLIGGAGDDVLDGGGANDGDGGVDVMIGGQGDDAYEVDSLLDVVTEVNGQGYDTVESSVNYTLGTAVEALFLTGNATLGAGNGLDNFIDSSDVTSAATTLRGNGGNDILIGSQFNDKLYGGNGDDGLIGGFGADYLHGGAGADVYVFDVRNLMEPTAVDRIVGFSQVEGDTIDFTLLDAVETIDAFVGTAAFSGTAREVRYQQVGTNTFVQVDWDADGNADFSIRVDGVVNFVAGDFVL